MTAIIVTVIVFVALISLFVCLAKRSRKRNREAAERIAMAPVSRRTPSQPVDTTTPQVSYAPVSTNADMPPPDYPYPLESPPPYPSKEQIPQFPPPGQSYPWQQSTPAEESVTHENSWRFFDDFNPVLRSPDKLELKSTIKIKLQLSREAYWAQFYKGRIKLSDG